MSGWSHLVLLPIVLPLIAGCAMLLFDGGGRWFKASLNLAATIALAVTAVTLLQGSLDLNVLRACTCLVTGHRHLVSCSCWTGCQR